MQLENKNSIAQNDNVQNSIVQNEKYYVQNSNGIVQNSNGIVQNSNVLCTNVQCSIVQMYNVLHYTKNTMKAAPIKGIPINLALYKCTDIRIDNNIDNIKSIF